MTNKEQALVAAAYRAAAVYAREFLYDYSSTLAPDGLHDDIISIIPAEAEAKLRELMLKAAFSVASSIYTNAEVEKVVDEVLNGHQ